jgi:quercetin dioxygenase-like cupin family protein
MHPDLETQPVPPGAFGRYDVLGPTVEFFTPPGEESDYSAMLGTLPPRGTVPLHSHPDDESFYLLSGTMQGLMERAGRFEWFDVPPAGFVHVPANAKHAWRNTGAAPVVQLIIVSARLGRFFREACRPLKTAETSRAPTPDEMQRFAKTAMAYGHWLGTPQENAAVGISL